MISKRKRKKIIVPLVKSTENQKESNDDLTLLIMSRLSCLFHFSYY